MYTPINCWKLCPKGKNLYESIEKMERHYKIKQVSITKEQFEMLLRGMTEEKKAIYTQEIPVGKLMVKRL